jgi:hypothetical protein
MALTLQAIEVMAARYSGRKNLAGFELLNEPAEMYGGEIANVSWSYCQDLRRLSAHACD